MKMTRLFFIAVLLLTLALSANGQADDAKRISEIQRMKRDTNMVNAWLDLSRTYKNSNYPLAEQYADSAVKVGIAIKFFKGAATGYNESGRAASSQSKYDVAEASYKSALAYYDSVAEESKMAIVLNNLSVIKRDQGQFDEAMEYLFQALAIGERINDTTGIANAFTNIAVVYAIKTDYSLAEEYFLKALDLWRKLKNQKNEHTILLNLGGLLVESQKYDEAIGYLNNARLYFEENGPETELGRAHYNLGNVYLEKNELDKSEGNYLIAKSIFDEIGQNMRAIGCLLRLSSVAEKRGNLTKAIEYAQESYERNAALGILNMSLRSVTQLSHLYELKKDYKRAFEFHKEQLNLRDSIASQDAEKQIAELEAKYQNEAKERQLAAATSELELQELKVKRQQVQQRILLGIVIGIALFLLLLVYQFRTKQKTNEVLEEKNALIQKSLGEKEVLLKEIHHRVKNNLQFISSMLNLQARHVKDEHALAVLLESKTRIHSMALVHQKLYQEDNLTGVSMQAYLNNLLDSLQHSYKIQKENIKVETTVDPLELDIDTAMPIGLLVNEMITNSFKYAFGPGQVGLVNISLVEKDKNLELIVQDNGRGFTEQVEQVSADRFGFKLMKSLADKLGGTLDIDTTDGVSIKLNITNYKKV